MKSLLMLFFLSTCIVLPSCGGGGNGKKPKPPPVIKPAPPPEAKPVSPEVLAAQRTIANSNSAVNAKKWQAANGASADLNLLLHGDSSQKVNCPQGDGWATVDLLNADQANCPPCSGGVFTLRLKCSTVNAQLGCLQEAEFTKKFAKQENICNTTLSATLKAITP